MRFLIKSQTFVSPPQIVPASVLARGRYEFWASAHVGLGIPRESGQGFRREGGHPSDVKAATDSETKAATDSDVKAATF